MWGFSLPLNGLCPLLSSCLFFFFDCTCSSSSFVTLLCSSFPSSSHCPLLLLLVLCCLILSPVFCPLHPLSACVAVHFCSFSAFYCLLLYLLAFSILLVVFLLLLVFIAILLPPPLSLFFSSLSPPFCYISPLSFASSFTSEHFTSHTDTGLPLRFDHYRFSVPNHSKL